MENAHACGMTKYKYYEKEFLQCGMPISYHTKKCQNILIIYSK